ncbi:hypothetical protein LIER_01812 [Lithospermum erythrorhizon]|uniref:Uncharacterized protein n=1 Tax=Lithospermum erythrorhizon TaxID=34254 RepID=A0AAV3NNI5_LITER
MGPPPDKVRAPVSKPSIGKTSKEPQILEEVKTKTVPGLITDYQLRQISNHYCIPDIVKTRIPLEGEIVDTPSTNTDAPQGPEVLPDGTPAPIFKDTTLFWESFNYGLRLLVSGFVDEVLMSLDRAPGQLMPFDWLVMSIFQVACLSIGVLPIMAMFSVMYNIIHKAI